jgi:uncharacterized protein
MKAANALILILFASSLFAACPSESREISMAAVVDENSGGLFTLHVDVKPGTGKIFTSIDPRIGFSTQESEQGAVDYAFSHSSARREECDVFFSMRGNFGSNRVDGPSAGGAMSIAVKAALTNQSIRRDVVMTGTISPEGSVGEVGGIIEKAIAAKDAGAKYILVPKMMLHEALLLSTLSDSGGFAAIEVANFSEAESIFFSPYSEEFTPSFMPSSDAMPAHLPEQAYDADTGRFSLVASRLVDNLESKASSALSSAPAATASGSRQYFSDEISKYRRQITAGYPFTAANSAFLLSVDAEYLAISDSEVDINGSIADVASCIASLPAPAKTKENFHWAVGADLRRVWAQNRLNDTIAAREGREGYSTLRDLLYAYSWCGISRELAAQADDIGGTPVNESALKQLSEDWLSEADGAVSSASFPNGDAYSHLDSGYGAYDLGLYGAAIYEAAYAKAAQQAADEAGGKNFSSAADALANGTRDSLWGKIYFGQGLYLNYASKEKLASATDAYRVLSYSSELDSASSEIDEKLAPGEARAAETAPTSAEWSPASPPRADGRLDPFAAFLQRASESLALYATVLSLAILVFVRMGKSGIDWRA